MTRKKSTLQQLRADGPPPSHPRIAAASASLGRAERELAADLGFDHVLLDESALLSGDTLADLTAASLIPLVRLRLGEFAAEDPLCEKYAEYFGSRDVANGAEILDPRQIAPASGTARVRLGSADLPAEITQAIRRRIGRLLGTGVRGFVAEALDAGAAHFYEMLFADLRKDFPDALIIGSIPGLPREDAQAISQVGFDYLLSSFAWWDLKARWLIEEHALLSPHCPLIAEITPSAANRTTDPVAAHALFTAALFTGSGLIAPFEFLSAHGNEKHLRTGLGSKPVPDGTIEMLTSAGSPITGLIRYDAASERNAGSAMVLLINSSNTPQPVPGTLLDGRRWRAAGNLAGGEDALAPLGPYEARLVEAKAAKSAAGKPRNSAKAASTAAKAPRIVIENLKPAVAGDNFAVKCLVGERQTVTADIYTDGHEKVGARLLWRAERDKAWQTIPMLEEGNDEWAASFTPVQLGRHEYAVEAWDDRFGYYRESLAKKVAAGVAQEVDFMEGRQLLEHAAKTAKGEHKRTIEDALAAFVPSFGNDARLAAVTDPALVEAMDALDPRHHLASSKPQLVDAERREARFSSWYELFPRSMTGDKQRHGTLRDVIDHLPRVAAMGFDTLYFPPVHPIGTTNRKGPNNTLTPDESDPGSPYAIGSEDGGHDALHPELGTLDDFRALVGAAQKHGLELALDFAIQCSPDHPWLRGHPGWFAWRPDGSMKYAENPPKKYQDIVNVDFYGPDAVPGLWLALRDVVLFWVAEGVKVFRVDNPHTKPLPFWEWMIREVRQAHPEVIFLSEAFTRPKVMYRLAKIGFSQSYTYFTWRNSKPELTEYIEELTSTAPKDFFRPHFFVNTPDINPVFLQTGGRPAHRIRAVLAATLSGLWGVYSGFELCDAAPLPGREEYLDSEKFEIRPREWRTPGDIVDDVTLLNRLRRSHPALQTHLNTRFYAAYDDNLIYYGKPSPDGGDMILVMVNLDPHGAHGCEFEVPLWEFGLPDDAAIAVEDLARGERFEWSGKQQSIHLTPDDPYRIWRIEPKGGANG